MENKIKLFLDFDETLVKTIKSFVDVKNSIDGSNVDYRDCKKWDFTDVFPNLTKEEMYEIFDSFDFFDRLELFEGAVDTLVELMDCYEYNFVTMGKQANLFRKEYFLIDKLIDFASYGFIAVDEEKYSDKSHVDMEDSIFIDDRIDNLRTSNAKVKILFKAYNDFEWQQVEPNEDIYIVNTWSEIRDILLFISENRFVMGV